MGRETKERHCILEILKRRWALGSSLRKMRTSEIDGRANIAIWLIGEFSDEFNQLQAK